MDRGKLQIFVIGNEHKHRDCSVEDDDAYTLQFEVGVDARKKSYMKK